MEGGFNLFGGGQKALQPKEKKNDPKKPAVEELPPPLPPVPRDAGSDVRAVDQWVRRLAEGVHGVRVRIPRIALLIEIGGHLSQIGAEEVRIEKVTDRRGNRTGGIRRCPEPACQHQTAENSDRERRAHGRSSLQAKSNEEKLCALIYGQAAVRATANCHRASAATAEAMSGPERLTGRDTIPGAVPPTGTRTGAGFSDSKAGVA